MFILVIVTFFMEAGMRRICQRPLIAQTLPLLKPLLVSIPLYVCLDALSSLPFPSLPLPSSLPLQLQFQPFVQFIGRRVKETSCWSPGQPEVQCAHIAHSTVCQEEEQRLAAAAQRQEQSLWFSQWGVSQTQETDYSFIYLHNVHKSANFDFTQKKRWTKMQVKSVRLTKRKSNQSF